ncbi:hypothetical protein MTYM_00608 [Methylococcales bacterium]|nr:hypothetical protein MTYM_00608 [Methylococcales bacterium]
MLQPRVHLSDRQPQKRENTRSLLFAMNVTSPITRLHLASKLTLVLVISLLVVRFMQIENLDPIGAGLMLAFALFGLYLSGTLNWVFRSYLIMLFPAVIGVAITWIVFNPDPGRGAFLYLPVYPGYVTIGVSLQAVILALVTLGWYRTRKTVFWGLIIGLVLTSVITHFIGNPMLAFGEVTVYHPLSIVISQQNLIIALTKSLGYGSMIFASLLLITTTRDAEWIGLMTQLRIPYIAHFFIATMLRSLNMALLDYSTIRQAQIVRGINLKKGNLFQTIRDLAYMTIPLTATMLHRSTNVGDAALARGFSVHTETPTEFHEAQPFAILDWAVLGACISAVLVTVFMGCNFTHLIGITL